MLKHILLSIALVCSASPVFAHSEGGKTKQGCHKHGPKEPTHCHP